MAALRNVETRGQAPQTPQPTAYAPAQPTQPLPPLDVEEVNAAWARFKESLPASEMYVKSLMDQSVTCSGNVIRVSIKDPSQASICKRDDLLHFLRHELERYDIVVETVIDTAEGGGRATPYTSMEKLQAMVSENESLQRLIEVFGLQLD